MARPSFPINKSEAWRGWGNANFGELIPVHWLKRVPHGGFLTPKLHVCRKHQERAFVAGVGTTSHLAPGGPVAMGLTPHGKSLHV